MRTTCALTLIQLIFLPTFTRAAFYAPTHFLGQCLDQAWVDATAQQLNLTPTARDAVGRLVNPHLHVALKETRFAVSDPRTRDVPMSDLYQSDCGTGAGQFYGVGSKVDPVTGTILDRGEVNGSLVVEFQFWASSFLMSSVFSILTREILGYPVSIYDGPNSRFTDERMSSVRSGACSPVHMNCDEQERPPTYANESYSAGSMGFAGQWGLYVNTDLVANGLNTTKFSPPFAAGYWFDYASKDSLINSLPVSQLTNNPKYFPLSTPWCADGFLGCRDGCSRTEACTKREGNGKECLVVVMTYPTSIKGYIQAVFDNLDIPAYFCFLGPRMMEYVAEARANGTNVLFVYFEPDQFHFVHENEYERVFLPRYHPEDATLSTNSFGENGYGVKTTNPVNVDFPPTPRLKYASNVVQELQPLSNFISRFTINELHINKLLRTYVKYTSEDSSNPLFQEDPKFSAACSWIRENYDVWSLWIPRLPECDLFTHKNYSISGCDSDTRRIEFAWLIPDPDNTSNPYACDGGSTVLPAFNTSRSCAWLNANFYGWIGWTIAPPPCDDSFYTFDTSSCDSAGTRSVTYRWILPNADNSSLSQECTGNSLPASVVLECDHVPYEAPIFTTVAILASILIAFLIFMIGFVCWFRHEPIIKRSQWEFLIVMIIGGILMCAATLVYAGKPTAALCSARPVVTSTSFTLIFGALLMKSLRVYRVFMSKAMKRVVLSSAKMFRMLGLFLLVDALILTAWFVVDYPTPAYTLVSRAELAGDEVTYHECTSSSFIFSALLIFWKAIVLLVGLYLSFLIRNVSTDFQESLWIFASSMVVLFASVILLPMAYLVQLPALTFYTFLSLALLFSTAIVMGMMLIPKVVRLHDTSETSTTSAGTTSGNDTSSHESSGSEKAKLSRFRIPTKATPTVTPIMPFTPQSKPSNRADGKQSDISLANDASKTTTAVMKLSPPSNSIPDVSAMTPGGVGSIDA